MFEDDDTPITLWEATLKALKEYENATSIETGFTIFINSYFDKYFFSVFKISTACVSENTALKYEKLRIAVHKESVSKSPFNYSKYIL